MADIALFFPNAIKILNKYELDYCCQGKKKFEEVCTKENLNAELIWAQILEAKAEPSIHQHTQFETWDISLLIDFIVQNHHRYIRESVPKIQLLLRKVCTTHGDDEPGLHMVHDDFDSLAEELLAHLPKEEEALFPLIKKLVYQNNCTTKTSLLLTNLNAHIFLRENEHESVGDLIKSIRSLTHFYKPSASACSTYNLTFKMLKEFDNDLMQHIHIENNILFPKAKLMNAI